MSSVLPVMTSVSTCSGRVGATPSTAFRMSATTLSGSRPYSHSTVIVAIPLVDVDWTFVTPETPLSARSSGVDTSSATICGETPG